MRYSEASTDAAYFHLVREMRDTGIVARFTIDGEPVSKARARFTSKGHSYTPEATVTAEKSVAAAFRKAVPQHRPDTETSYGVTALFFHGTRQRRDVDNMVKLILDGLNGVAWADDAQVVEVSGRKCIESKEHARTEVLVYQVGQVQRLTMSCRRCGQTFETFPSGTRTYCSRACGYADRKPAHRPPCVICGTPVAQAQSRYCSRACMSIGRTKPKPRCASCGEPVSKQGVRMCRPCFEGRDPEKGPHRIRIEIEDAASW